MVRSLLLKIHLGLALAVGLFLLIAGLTGSVLAFGPELDHALDARLWRVTPSSDHRLSLAAAAAIAVRDRPEQRTVAIRLPRAADEAYEFTTDDRTQVYVDPYKGTLLGTRRREATFVGRVQALHTRLFAGEAGRALMGLAAALTPLLILSGLYLFWPRKGLWKKAFRIRRAPPRALARDLHGIAGFVGALVLLVLAVTGALLAFTPASTALLHRLAGSSEPAPPPTAVRDEGMPVPPDTALKIADQALPGAMSTQLLYPSEKGGPYTIVKRDPSDKTPNGRSRVWVASRGGEVLRVDDASAAAAGAKLVNGLRPLHTGDALGGVGRLVFALGSALGPGLFVTGLMIWLGKRKRAEAAEEAAEEAPAAEAPAAEAPAMGAKSDVKRDAKRGKKGDTKGRAS